MKIKIFKENHRRGTQKFHKIERLQLRRDDYEKPERKEVQLYVIAINQIWR